MNNGQQCSTLVHLLQERAICHPQKKAFIFLQNETSEVGSLTYLELDTKAQAIAATLQKLGISGKKALLLYPTGLEFISAFFGCLYANVVAIPSPLPDAVRLKRTLPRLQALIKDAQVSVVLIQSQDYAQIKEVSAQFSEEFQAVHWIVSEEIPAQLAQKWQEPAIGKDTLAYLQYTSGSTSTPKGVMISHGNLMHHCADIQKAWGYTSESIATTWVPHFHDYGLVDGLLQPLYSGISCYMISPVAFYMRPIRWLQTISRYRVTHSQGPNFAYEHCLNRIKPEQQTNLDLSSWQTASNGAEPIRQDTIERFIQTYEPYGFRRSSLYPAYGLAEATLLVSTKQHGDEPNICAFDAEALEKNRVVAISQDEGKRVRTIVSCGSLIGNIKAVIANPETLAQCEPLEVGEIWISDPSVALGYWGKHEETESTFRAHLTDSGEGPFLRTGDLGFIKDGELFVTGRIKDVVIIRGRNHYPQDIELTVEQSHPSLRTGHGAALGVNFQGEEKLIIIQEVKSEYNHKLDLDEVLGNICEAVRDEHELQVYAVILTKAGSIPKTSSGKIQRSACRNRFLNEIFNQTGSGAEELGHSQIYIYELTNRILSDGNTPFVVVKP
jgi:acyl-CoA synthetase (AMP-forming)/AMP-acid ligase II